MPTINFTVDGKPVSVNADNNEELLWVLRDRLGVNSVKYGCGVGLDGVCTAIVNGQAVRTCITPVGSVAGGHVTTVAGLSDGEHLHPVQQAWVDNDVAQCGYCQAGQIMSAVALLNKNPPPTPSITPSEAPNDEALLRRTCGPCRSTAGSGRPRGRRSRSGPRPRRRGQ